MPVDLRGFKVIYKNCIYNCVCAELQFLFDANEDYNAPGVKRPDKIFVTIMDEDGQLCTIRDKANEFQFVRNKDKS